LCETETDSTWFRDASSRAAILTPSPIGSPSLFSTTSPRWMPTRDSMRRSCGRPARPQPRQCPMLIRACKPAVSDHIGRATREIPNGNRKTAKSTASPPALRKGRSACIRAITSHLRPPIAKRAQVGVVARLLTRQLMPVRLEFRSQRRKLAASRRTHVTLPASHTGLLCVCRRCRGLSGRENDHRGNEKQSGNRAAGYRSENCGRL
jgi:hypothetical protein